LNSTGFNELALSFREFVEIREVVEFEPLSTGPIVRLKDA
jgi:hypothetical protein